MFTQRFKRSGMRWKHASGQVILDLRVIYLSNILGGSIRRGFGFARIAGAEQRCLGNRQPGESSGVKGRFRSSRRIIYDATVITPGYLVREAPASDVKDLQQLAGHLAEGLFITKFRKTFARDEMNDDLSIVPARYKGTEDTSEYEEILPSSPP